MLHEALCVRQAKFGLGVFVKENAGPISAGKVLWRPNYDQEVIEIDKIPPELAQLFVQYGYQCAENYMVDPRIPVWNDQPVVGAVKLEPDMLKFLNLDPEATIYVEDATFVNHSCAPNIGWQRDEATGDWVMISLQQLPAGTEIVMDYGEMETSDADFTCGCGNPNCRGAIKGTDYLLLHQQNPSRVFPEYIQALLSKAESSGEE